MTEKFQNKYRIASARWQNWDYGCRGAYFITLCTANREYFFGEIENGKMEATEIGSVAEQEWIKTIEIRPDMNLSFGDFVVMPNHFHAIIFIGENKYNAHCTDAQCRDAMHRVSTTGTPSATGTPTPIITNKFAHHFGPQSKNLASIMRGFKSAITTYARKNNILFGWQPRYHDHVIRNGQEYNMIANYIQNNIAHWKDDKFYKK